MALELRGGCVTSRPLYSSVTGVLYMNHFSRALKAALKFRWTLAAAFLSSSLVAILWGGNIGALYPVIQVAFQGRSLQEWTDDEIASLREHIAEHERELQQINQQPDGAVQAKSVEFELLLERQTLAARERIKPWIDRYLPNDPFRTVALVVGILIASTAIKGVFVFCNNMCVARLEQRLTYDIRRQFYHQVLRMDLSSFGNERASGMLSRFNTDINFLTSGVRNLFGSAVREPLKMVACLVGASLISWRLLLFSLLLAPVIGFSVRKLASSIKRANRRVMEEIQQLYGVLSETFNGIQTVQAYTLEQRERKRFRYVSKQCLEKSMTISFYSALTKPITETMGIVMISLALLAGAYLALNGETHLFGIRLADRRLDVPSLLVFYGLLIGTTEPARKLSEIFNSIQAGVAAADRLYPMLDKEPLVVSPQDPTPLPTSHQQIQFENVSFHYAEGVGVLNGIDLTVNFGETIAIVGPNGCGKTTLVQLLPRFFDPTTGQVKLDGVDLRDVRLRDLRQRIGMVTQQSAMFDDTVFRNIAAGRIEATHDEVLAAAKKARAHQFIVDKLEAGYDTVVGTSGGRLSGGQRQRIALARAILRQPEILILDEATSQVDLESEQLIHQALDEFAVGRTVFMITHRMSTLSLADRVLVMNGGCVEGFDTHSNLIQSCGLYRRLYDLQFKKSA